MANCAVIKQSIRIEDVIGRVVPLKRHGHWYVGRCPFHNDRHPSLVVWPKTDTWKCMTCSPVRDDVIGFVVRWKHCSTQDALRWLEQEHPEMPLTPRTKPASGATPLAALPDRDVTYQELLGHWGLTAHHRAALRARGLSDWAIGKAGFASVIPGLAPVTPVSAGVPGFSRQGSRWRIVGPAGIAIPVRDVQGQIQAVHVRSDDPSKGKYRWLSTPAPTYVGGAASGAPVHVVRGVDDVVWITEGPLKAIVAQARLGHTVLGVPGAGAWTPVLDLLAVVQPKRVIIAFDRDPDPETAGKVAQHVGRLTHAITNAGWPLMMARWDGPKGLDDALVAGARITFEQEALLQ